MRRRIGILFASLVLLVGAAALGIRELRQPIPFDAATWREADAKLRFRMKDSLLAKRATGELATRDAVDAVLGPDDEHGEEPGYRYFRLKEWYGNPWYLRITFDEAGRVTRFMVAVD
jgi:hypothetical protein